MHASCGVPILLRRLPQERDLGSSHSQRSEKGTGVTGESIYAADADLEFHDCERAPFGVSGTRSLRLYPLSAFVQTAVIGGKTLMALVFARSLTAGLPV